MARRGDGICRHGVSTSTPRPAASRSRATEKWATRQVWESTTEKAMDLSARTVTFSEIPMSRLRRSHLEQWVKVMTDAGLKAWDRSHTHQQRPGRPPRCCTRPRHRARPQPRARAPPSRQARALDHGRLAPSGPRDSRRRRRAIVASSPLAAFAGLRLGEAAAVQVGDIDFLHRSLRVRRQVQRAGGGAVEIRAPKYRSERVVFLFQTGGPCSSLSTSSGTPAMSPRPGCSRERV